MGVVKKQGLQNTVISYVGSLLGFLNKVLLLPKIFVVEQVGLINVLASFSLLYAQISGFGVYSVVIRFFPQYKGEHQGVFLRLVFRWLFLGFLFLTILFVVFAEQAKLHLFNKSPLLQEYFNWILPLAFLILLFEVLDSYSRAILKSVFPSILKDFLLRVVFLIGIVCYYFDWLTFDGFVILFVLSYGLNLLLLLAYLSKEGALKIPRSTAKLYLKPIFSFGIFVFLAESSSLLVSTIDAIMLSEYNGLSDVGIYTTMVFLTSAFMIPYRSLSKVATPIVARLWQEDKRDQIQTLYSQFSLTSFSLGAVLFLAILANIEVLFLILPQEYVKGVYILVVIGMARMVELFYGLNNAIMVNSPKYVIDLGLAIFLIVLTITTNFLFIPTYGMKGAAFASFLSIVAINVLRGIFLKKLFNFRLFNMKSVTLILLFIGSLVAFYFLEFNNMWLELAANNLVLCFFLASVLVLKLSPELNKWLIEVRERIS
jgi:O-antigen/teichoic acid export membrane protein